MTENVQPVKGRSPPCVGGSPSLFRLDFSDAELARFLADPTAVLRKLGRPTDPMQFKVHHTAWMVDDGKWVSIDVQIGPDRDLDQRQTDKNPRGFERRTD